MRPLEGVYMELRDSRYLSCHSIYGWAVLEKMFKFHLSRS